MTSRSKAVWKKSFRKDTMKPYVSNWNYNKIVTRQAFRKNICYLLGGVPLEKWRDNTKTLKLLPKLLDLFINQANVAIARID